VFRQAPETVATVEFEVIERSEVADRADQTDPTFEKDLIYPMNPSWLNGMMPESMYRHEHPDHLEEAKGETEAHIRKRLERLSALGEDVSVDEKPPDGDA